VVPAIFEISIPKNPLGQSFMLLSGSAHQFHISAPLNGIFRRLWAAARQPRWVGR